MPSEVLGAEITSARQRGARTIFAGIELVAIPGVTELNTEQIRVDASEFRRTADGLVLSSDLWHIALESLEFLSI